MIQLRAFFALLLCLLMVSPVSYAQMVPNLPEAQLMSTKTPKEKPDVPRPSGTGMWSDMSRPYRQADIPVVNLRNTDRLEALIRAGKIYLSLQDSIALALENNLDIELSRYGPQIAQTDYLRAAAGGLLRGVPTTVQSGPSSALAQTGISGSTSGIGGQAGQSGSTGGAGGTVITQTGVSIPLLDPQFFFSLGASHLSRPQANTVTTGGNAAITLNTSSWNAGYQQQFLTNTTVSAAWNNSYVLNNNPYNDLNPNTSGNIQIQITQRVLQGWGIAVNNRNIRVAKNNIYVSDLVFEQQVMTTVSAVVNLYWDLVSFIENYKVKQQALAVAVKFLEDNKKQVEIGTLAPIEIVRAEANVAQAQLNVSTAETSVLQQENILKTALSRTGMASPSVLEARIVPTDMLRMPAEEQLGIPAAIVEKALSQRPDLQQTRVNIDNVKIGIAGSRSQLLPSLDVQGYVQNNGLTGSANTVPPPPGSSFIANPNPYFIGGYGNALAQIFRRNFPDYSIGFQLSIPIRNRTAQADYIRDMLGLRQQQLSEQQLINSIRQSVSNAIVGLEQARVSYKSAVKARQLQEQTLDAVNKKYALGASTSFEVVSTQRDLAQAQSDEVATLAAFSRAQVQLDLTTADILTKYNISMAEAKKGVVAKAPTRPAGGS
jgi:outer membrane protein